MNKKNKGFTLIELLAVIVILGILMAIAIPSINNIITQSRKKTLVSSIDGYISSTVPSVSDQDYEFSTLNTIYAIPIECIPLEQGGKNPLGEWMQANNDYWAYVLVQYDSENLNYIYGFTFKDSSGYGMYPTSQSEIQQNGRATIKKRLDLIRPTSGAYTNIAEKDNWIGFKITDDTEIIVLEAESKGNPGDGENTCTLCQEGSNYQEVENEKNTRLINRIKNDNPLITDQPTLTTSSSEAGDASGLYMSTDTNSGKPTYYFRGGVNNYLKFAELTWRIVRINEDGSVRLMLNDRIGLTPFNSTYGDYTYMYYSKSDTSKKMVDDWYAETLSDYDSYIVTGMFCEQAKVKSTDDRNETGNAEVILYTEYIPNFKCSTDGNGKGILNLKAGLITYDEVVFAGNYHGKASNSYTVYPSSTTMSSAGSSRYLPYIWIANGAVSHTANTQNIRPVINIKGNLIATGTGKWSDPYIVKTE